MAHKKDDPKTVIITGRITKTDKKRLEIIAKKRFGKTHWRSNVIFHALTEFIQKYEE